MRHLLLIFSILLLSCGQNLLSPLGIQIGRALNLTHHARNIVAVVTVVQNPSQAATLTDPLQDTNLILNISINLNNSPQVLAVIPGFNPASPPNQTVLVEIIFVDQERKQHVTAIQMNPSQDRLIKTDFRDVLTLSLSKVTTLFMQVDKIEVASFKPGLSTP